MNSQGHMQTSICVSSAAQSCLHIHHKPHGAGHKKYSDGSAIHITDKILRVQCKANVMNECVLNFDKGYLSNFMLTWCTCI